MTPYQLFALDWFLSDYPEDETFEEILEMVADESDDITPLEDYEDFWGSHVAGLIEELAVALERDFMYMGESRATN